MTRRTEYLLCSTTGSAAAASVARVDSAEPPALSALLLPSAPWGPAVRDSVGSWTDCPVAGHTVDDDAWCPPHQGQGDGPSAVTTYLGIGRHGRWGRTPAHGLPGSAGFPIAELARAQVETFAQGDPNSKTSKESTVPRHRRPGGPLFQKQHGAHSESRCVANTRHDEQLPIRGSSRSGGGSTRRAQGSARHRRAWVCHHLPIGSPLSSSDRSVPAVVLALHDLYATRRSASMHPPAGGLAAGSCNRWI